MAKRDTFTLDIYFDRIPASAGRTFERKDGSQGMCIKLLMVPRKMPDLRGNTYSICLPQTLEERRKREPATFVGDARCWGGGWNDENDE